MKCLIPLQQKIFDTKELQRKDGILLAAAIRKLRKADPLSDLHEALQKEIDDLLRKIDLCSRRIDELNAQIEQKTAGLSSHMKHLAINEGAVY